jgi:pimeloyl-ACP methyl ester carboxylesterase
MVLLIHGSMDRSAGMLKLSRVLDDERYVVRYDRRGYGRSPSDGPFAMPEQVDDARRVLDDRTALVIGHSYGGNVALALAEAVPDQVVAVVVYETPVSWEPWWPGTTAGAAAVAAGADTAAAAEAFMLRMIGTDRWEALPERTKSARRSEGAAMVGELADLRQNRPWRAEGIRVPVRCGYGEFGAAHHRRGMEHVAAELADGELVELPGCGHDAPMRAPEVFAERLVEGFPGRRP